MKKVISLKKVVTLVLAGMISLFTFASQVVSDTGGMASLRGISALDTVSTADNMKRVPKDRETLERDYLHQPPLIPHQTRGYKLDLNSNKCLSCHSWKNYKQAGATKISMTHFETRDGQQLSDVSPRRYFCTQCHVTQADAKPLIKNNFKSVDTLK